MGKSSIIDLTGIEIMVARFAEMLGRTLAESVRESKYFRSKELERRALIGYLFN